MEVPVENIRLSQKAKDQLIKLKRKTRIYQWNILCRWALCLSLAEPTRVGEEIHPADSSVEMTWRTFGGPYHEVYIALLKERCRRDGIEIDQEVLAHQFRNHLHRGIAILFGDKEISGVADLVGKVVPQQEEIVAAS